MSNSIKLKINNNLIQKELMVVMNIEIMDSLLW